MTAGDRGTVSPKTKIVLMTGSTHVLDVSYTKFAQHWIDVMGSDDPRLLVYTAPIWRKDEEPREITVNLSYVMYARPYVA